MSKPSYRLKVIKWKGKQVPICLQNENGPCPLLAIGNILLLKGCISIHTDYAHISTEQLMTLIGDYLLTLSPKFEDDGLRKNNEKNRSDAIAMFPQLQVGLDVNVKFKDIHDFEFTRELLIFDLLNINLCHGWLVDPVDKINYKLLVDELSSYNRVVEKLVVLETLKSSLKSTNSTNTSDVHTQNSTQVTTTPGSDESLNLSSDQQLKYETTLKEGALLNKFMSDTASQLTFYGLTQLYDKVKEHELAVFFRNNHFNTLYKHNNHLYILVTDLGYLTEPNVVWEKLDQIDGDTQFVDSEFTPHASHSDFSENSLVEHISDSHSNNNNIILPDELYQQQELQQMQYEQAQLGASDHDVAVALHYELNKPQQKDKKQQQPKQQQSKQQPPQLPSQKKKEKPKKEKKIWG